MDLKHQGGEIRIDTDDDTVTLYDEPVFDAKSFLQVYKDNNQEAMEEGWPSSYPRAEFSDAVHKAIEAGLDKDELHRIVDFG